MKKMIVSLSAILALSAISLTPISANEFSTSLAYTYEGVWRNGFTAGIYESGGSPVAWKRISGFYNTKDYNSGRISTIVKFDSGLVQGQPIIKHKVGINSRYQVNCTFERDNRLINTRSLNG